MQQADRLPLRIVVTGRLGPGVIADPEFPLPIEIEGLARGDAAAAEGRTIETRTSRPPKRAGHVRKNE